MSKILGKKEWLSFDEALRYACAFTGETIKNEDFLPILLEKKVPIIIYPKDFGCSVDESDSFKRYSYLLRLLPSSKLHFYCEVSLNRTGQDSNSLGIETEYGLLTPIHYLGVAVNPDISFLMPRLPDYSQSDTYYEYMALLVDEIKDGKKINSHASAVYYHMWNTDNKEHDMNMARIDCITWQDLLSPVIGKNGIGIDGSFIKPLFKRDAIDSLLNFDTTQDESNSSENEDLKIKIAELEQRCLIEKEPISTLQAVGIMAQLLASSERGNKYRIGENNKPNAKAIGDAVANKARTYFGEDIRGFDSFNKKISESLKLLEKK